MRAFRSIDVSSESPHGTRVGWSVYRHGVCHDSNDAYGRERSRPLQLYLAPETYTMKERASRHWYDCAMEILGLMPSFCTCTELEKWADALVQQKECDITFPDWLVLSFYEIAHASAAWKYYCAKVHSFIQWLTDRHTPGFMVCFSTRGQQSIEHDAGGLPLPKINADLACRSSVQIYLAICTSPGLNHGSTSRRILNACMARNGRSYK